MVIHLEDELSQTLGESEHDKRHDIWLWHTLSFFYKNFNPEDFPNTGMRKKMALYLQQDIRAADELLKERRKQLVPKKELAWITDERRLVEWLTKALQNATSHDHIKYPFKLTGKDLPIAIIDVWPRDITEKISLLKNLEQQWKHHKINDKTYKWFKDDNQKCSFAHDWLERNVPFAFIRATPIETYEDLLIFFDNANYTPEKEELYIGKIKRSWNQKKYKDSLKDKAQYNFILSNETIKKLDRISAQHAISRARTIEILIELEDLKGLYISEKLKMSKLLRND